MINNFFYPKGSEWRKWDLHTHTPIDPDWIDCPDLSTDESKRKFAFEYIMHAKDLGLSLIAITDHNFCNDLDSCLIPYIQKEAKAANITILPGFEICADEGSGIHLLAIFPQNTDLEKILKTVELLIPTFDSKISRRAGAVPSEKKLDKIKEILDQTKLEYILIFAHADNSNGVLDGKTINGNARIKAWQKPYVQIAQLKKSPYLYTSTFEKGVISKSLPEFSKDMTYITASDCRCIKFGEDRNYLGKNYIWVKADPTFEGLKQILYDPNSRIKYTNDEPEEKTSYLVIDKVRFIDNSNNHLFSEEWIEINPNLNTIIGGKSSGKSLLLYHIAKTIDPDQVENKLKVCQIREYRFDDSFDFEVMWKDGVVTSLKNDKNNRRQITYIPQLFINKLSEKEGEQQLHQQIQEILLQNDVFKRFYTVSQNGIMETNSKINQLCIDLFVKISNHKDAISALNGIGDKTAIEQEKSKVENEIAILKTKSGFTKKEITKFDTLRASKAKIENEIENNKSIINGLEELKRLLLNTLDDGLSSLNIEKDELLNIDGFDIQIANSLIEKIRASYKNEVELNFKIIEDYELKIKSKENELQTILAELQPLSSKFENEKQINSLNNKLADQVRILKQIEDKEKLIVRLNKSVEDCKTCIINEYIKLINLYTNIAKELKKEVYSNISDDIKLEASIELNKVEFEKSFIDLIDHRMKIDKNLESLISDDHVFNMDYHIQTITTVFNELVNEISNGIRLKDKKNKRDAVNKLLSDYLYIKYDLIQNSDRIMQMSHGKRGFVLLQLILHLSNAKHPILIDQPEDNLDNRTISKELFDYFMKKKHDRQIIMVTHNPNLVVLADAEEVIVANQAGQQIGMENQAYKFEYVSGSLECSFENGRAKSVLHKKGIKQHVCEILEGGAEAFEKREKKYGLKSLR